MEDYLKLPPLDIRISKLAEEITAAAPNNLRQGRGPRAVSAHPFRVHPGVAAQRAARSAGQFPVRAESGTLRILRQFHGGHVALAAHSVAHRHWISRRRIQRPHRPVRRARQQRAFLGGGLFSRVRLDQLRSDARRQPADAHRAGRGCSSTWMRPRRSGGSGSSTTTSLTSAPWARMRRQHSRRLLDDMRHWIARATPRAAAVRPQHPAAHHAFLRSAGWAGAWDWRRSCWCLSISGQHAPRAYEPAVCARIPSALRENPPLSGMTAWCAGWPGAAGANRHRKRRSDFVAAIQEPRAAAEGGDVHARLRVGPFRPVGGRRPSSCLNCSRRSPAREKSSATSSRHPSQTRSAQDSRNAG